MMPEQDTADMPCATCVQMLSSTSAGSAASASLSASEPCGANSTHPARGRRWLLRHAVADANVGRLAEPRHQRHLGLQHGTPRSLSISAAAARSRAASAALSSRRTRVSSSCAISSQTAATAAAK